MKINNVLCANDCLAPKYTYFTFYTLRIRRHILWLSEYFTLEIRPHLFFFFLSFSFLFCLLQYALLFPHFIDFQFASSLSICLHFIATRIFGVRHLQALLLFLGLTLAYAMRVNLSVAIVAITDKHAANPDFEVNILTKMRKQVKVLKESERAWKWESKSANIVSCIILHLI